jgi:four helix bundle protein
MPKGYQNLIVWQKAKDLAVQIYKLSTDGELNKNYGLRDQIRRAAVSIPSNIAEGDERDTDREAVRFFYVAKGSLVELRTQLQIAYEIGYLETDSYNHLNQETNTIANMLGALIRARSKSFNPGPSSL